MKRLQLLDYARFFAAVVVLLFHYTFYGIANGKIDSIQHIDGLIDFTKYGYLGVELFFMISGFVIFLSAKNKTATEFALSRAFRLYPAYWFAVIFTSVIAFFWARNAMTVDFSQSVVNLSMLQGFIGVDHVDAVYWTLVYEVLFYVLVFFILLFGLQRHLNTLFITWPVVMLGALISGYDALPFLGGYYCYFSAGALLAIVKTEKTLRSYTSLIIVFSLCLLFAISTASARLGQTNVHLSETLVGTIVVIYFVFFALLNTKKSQTLELPYSKTLGALTYPVYLIHAHFGYMFISKYANEENKISIYFITTSIVLVVAYLVHNLIEIRLAGFRNKSFTQSPSLSR